MMLAGESGKDLTLYPFWVVRRDEELLEQTLDHLIVLLTMCVQRMRVDNNPDSFEIIEVARDWLHLDEFAHLRLAMLPDFFRRWRSGEYGEFYNKVDFAKMGTALRKYVGAFSKEYKAKVHQGHGEAMEAAQQARDAERRMQWRTACRLEMSNEVFFSYMECLDREERTKEKRAKEHEQYRSTVPQRLGNHLTKMLSECDTVEKLQELHEMIPNSWLGTVSEDTTKRLQAQVAERMKEVQP